jgi:hypothetical protein
MFRTSLLSLLALVVSCGGTQVQTTSVALSFDQLERHRFNQLALIIDAPVFWVADENENGAVDPAEVRALLFYDTVGHWVDENGQFTHDFEDAYREMVEIERAGEPDDPRIALMHRELSAAAVSLVESDLSELPEAHQEFADRMLSVARTIDQLYARQVGVTALTRDHTARDPASRSVLRRNWGPKCVSPALEEDEACTALPHAPKQVPSVYPADLQDDEDFCEALRAREDAETLLSPFTVVREREGELVAVPYSEAYEEEMQAISTELYAAASVLQQEPNEEPLRDYLRAAAEAFTTNDWDPADEAWSQMNAENSRWYVRVAPDEVYWDPCSRKAAFHLTLALIDRASLQWQERLTPIQQDMEESIAALSEDYEPREVSFHLPDFIQIVVNAGDDRDAFGATIGQSLPNWGPVAEESRGRTVAMTNLYTDPDSAARRRTAAESLLTNDAMAYFTGSPNPGLMSTILHEATHNLGPAQEYRVDGKSSEEIFGGQMASMLEELKAQTGALFLLSLLKDRGVLDEAAVNEAYLDSIIWAYGHISRGMYTPSGQRKAYSQLAAIQVGELLTTGAMTWNPTRGAANGADVGSFSIDYAAMPAAAQALMQKVVQILATGDTEGAEALAAQHVDGDTVPMSEIAERYQRLPRASFVYAVTF